MLSLQHLCLLGLYLALLCVIGWTFSRFTATPEDYFAGGKRMRWWLLGADSFQSNFSTWVFTGAAGIAYTHGAVIFGFYFLDVLAFVLSWLWFAARFRALGVVTAIDAVRLRFGPKDERFFALLSLLATLAVASVRVLGLTVLLSRGFSLPPLPVIGVTITVVIFVALFGGSWAVAAMNLVQLVVVVCVTTSVAVLAVLRVGGWAAFLEQIPAGHWQVFQPAGTSQYDWVFLVTALLGATHAKNNLLFVSKYVAARDVIDARRSTLIPLVGYIVMPFVWMVPVFAAFTVAPDLAEARGDNHAGEWAYISVCKAILSPGLLGLVLVCMLGSTLSSVGMTLNVNAGTLTKNLYANWRGGRAGTAELVTAGKCATLFLGVVTGGVCVLFSTTGESLFDIFLYINAYIGVPLGIPLFMGIIVRGEPRWAPRATVGFIALVTLVVFHGLPLLTQVWTHPAWVAQSINYLPTHPFTATNLIIAPLGALFFFLTTFWRSAQDPSKTPLVGAEFFERMKQRVEADAPLGRNDIQQERMLGWFLTVVAALLGILALVEQSPVGILALVGCAVIPAVSALALLSRSRAEGIKP
jgi:solute:Na+ symporter, SSS family